MKSGGYRGQVAQIVVFTTIGDGFQIFGISPMGNAHTGDLPLPCHVYGLLLFYDRIVRQLIAGDPAAIFHQPYDALGVCLGLGNLIKRVLNQMVFFYINRSFDCSVCLVEENMQICCSTFLKCDCFLRGYRV